MRPAEQDVAGNNINTQPRDDRGDEVCSIKPDEILTMLKEQRGILESQRNPQSILKGKSTE